MAPTIPPRNLGGMSAFSSAIAHSVLFPLCEVSAEVSQQEIMAEILALPLPFSGLISYTGLSAVFFLMMM